MSLADEVLAEALRAREQYRARLRQLVHPLTDDDLEALHASMKADQMPEAVAVQDFLLRTDIRVACRREQQDRTAWAEVEQEQA